MSKVIEIELGFSNHKELVPLIIIVIGNDTNNND